MELLTFREAGRRYGVAHTTIGRICKKNRIEVIQAGGCKLLTAKQAEEICTSVEARGRRAAKSPSRQ